MAAATTNGGRSPAEFPQDPLRRSHFSGRRSADLRPGQGIRCPGASRSFRGPEVGPSQQLDRRDCPWVEIMGGSCSISTESIERHHDQDPAFSEILMGLSLLHEDLVFMRQLQTAAAEN